MLQFIVLGIVQGLTEFLPVSSSAHLSLLERLLSIKAPGSLVEALLHVGTLVAVFYYFRRRIFQLLQAPIKRDENLRLLFLLIVATLPTAVIGLLFKSWAEAAFARIWLIGGGLILTGGFLYFVEERLRRKRPAPKSASGLSFQEAFLIGILQGLAVFPGLSRSGLTIGMGLWRGLSREAAVEFSFVLSIPAVLGNALLSFSNALPQPTTVDAFGLNSIIAALIAALVGLLAIRFLLGVLIYKGLKPFAYYCWGVGLLAVILALVLR